MRPGPVIAVAVLAAVAAGAGWWAGRHEGPEGGGGSGPCPGGAQPLHWKAPMDPTYVRDAPGKSPMGMDLVPVCPGEAGGTSGMGEGVVRIDPALEQSMGVRTALVTRRDLSRQVRALGRVAYDERLVDHVHTKVQGWIEKLYVEYEGEMVQKGQPIAEIYSPELVSTQEELLQAARYRDATSKSSFHDVVEGGEALFDASKRRLELWDIPDRDIRRLLETGQVRKNLKLYAPGPGVVVDLKAREGMEVNPNLRLYTIADLSHIWIYADVYEYELPWVEVGQHGVAVLSYLPGQRFEGKVDYIYPFLDPKTRTARVRLEFPNPDLVLKPDMFANVTIQTQTRKGVLAVPSEAILRSGQRSLAIVARGEGRFEPRPVRLGIDGGDGWIEVTDGLAEGERVVTSGQFLIDSESRLQEAVEKMTEDEPSAESSPQKAPDAGAAMPGMQHGEHQGHDMGAAGEPSSDMPAMPGMQHGEHQGHDMGAAGAPSSDMPAMPGMQHGGHQGHDMGAMGAPSEPGAAPQEGPAQE